MGDQCVYGGVYVEFFSGLFGSESGRYIGLVIIIMSQFSAVGGFLKCCEVN